MKTIGRRATPDRRWVMAVTAALVAALVAVGAPGADATVTEQATYSDTYAYGYGECGYPVEVTGSVEGRYQIREGTNRDASAFFLHDSSSYVEVHRRTDTGQSFVVRGHTNFKETRATRLDGNVFEFVSVEAGQPFVVETSTGHVVLRDRGSIERTVLFDTSGDSDPGGTQLDFLSAKVRGPHPGYYADFCAIAGSLVGTGSAKRLTARPVGSTASPLGYYEYLPPGYQQDGSSPLLVALNGFGENGDGTAAELPNLLATGIPNLIADNGWPADRPFVVLAPQHPNPEDNPAYAPCDDLFQQGVPFGSCLMRIQHDLGNPPGSPCTTPTEVHDFLSYAIAAYHVDPRRVYLTGLSCGGFGAWEYVAQYGASQVAAVVPIAADGRPAWESSGCALGAVALWAFVGDADDVVGPEGTIEATQDLHSCPSPPRRDVQLTVYPGVDHDSWTPTYSLSAGHDIYSWFLGFTSS